VKYKQLCLRDKLPNYTAFDWSKRDEAVVGIGSASGEATIVQIDPDRPQGEFIHSFPIRHQRKCNSIAFSAKNYVATGLDRVRNDVCLNIYDLNNPNVTSTSEPYKKLASSEAISSIKFFSTQPDTLVAGVSRQCIRLYDLRGELWLPNISLLGLTQDRSFHLGHCSISHTTGTQHCYRSLGRELLHLSRHHG
jgi:WD40 repeat protein